MVFRIKIERGIYKALEKMPELDQRRILKRVDSLSVDPRPVGAKKLKGVGDLYRIRAGNYRIIYKIQDFILLVIVVRISHRKDVYRK